MMFKRCERTAAENRITSMEEVVRHMDTAVQVAKKALSDHTLKLADMDDRIRRNNIRLVGFPGGAEGRHPGGVSGRMVYRAFAT